MGSLRKFFLLFSICCARVVIAQDMSVSSFKILDTDLTANTHGTMEKDFNGEVAALIKMVTTEQGFVFDGGMVGIVKTMQKVGEVWVYVPHGIKKMTIQHPQLGVLRDYYFPIPIEKARTYEMVLTTGEVQVFVNQHIDKQFIEFEVIPKNATIELNEEPLKVDEEGHASKYVPFGRYTYRISANNYHTEAGFIEVNNPEKKSVIKKELRPNFGWLEIPASDGLIGADIYVNNIKEGKVPFKSGTLKSGVYKLKISKPLYKTYECEVVVEDNKVHRVDVVLVPNFAETTLIAKDGVDIYVDGQYKATGNWTGPLEIGSYTIEVRQDGHRSVSIVSHINSEEARCIQLPNPIPILSAIEITSNPSNATIMMDGKTLGTTPMLLPNVLVGKHDLTFSKKNYQTVTKQVEVKENEIEKLHVKLSGECSLRINTEPSGAEVVIDGKSYGLTPIACNLYAGNYTFGIFKEGYSSIEKTVAIDGSKDVFDFILKRRYVYSKMFYVNAGFSAINMLNVYGAVGLFYNNINAQLSYAYGFSQSETIYWNGSTGFYERTYNPQVLTSMLGYGFICGNRVRVTPQIGCSLLMLNEGKYEKGEDVILKGASMISGVVSMRCDLMLGPQFGLNITPQYLLPLWSSPWASKLKDLSATISDWDKGFSLQVGASLFF